MQNKPLRIMIVGAGAIAAVHISAYKMFPDMCRVVAVCDVFEEKAHALIAQTEIDAKAYTDYREALSDSGANIVSICLPPAMHASVAIDALNAGKHVLCEKPMASSLAECDAMLAAARGSGALLSVVAQNRYKIPNQKIKALLDSGIAGPVLLATINSLWWRGNNYYDLWWRGTWEREGGGCFSSHAVHHIDLLLWMLGMPQSVTAVLSNVAHDNSECEDVGVAVLQYPHTLAQITSSIVTHDEEQEIIFQCSKGRLSVPWRPAVSKALPNGFPESDGAAYDALEAAYRALPESPLEGHPAQVRNLLSAIRGEESLDIDGQQGRTTIELITAIYKSAYTKTPIGLPLAADDPFAAKGGIASHMPHFHEKTRSVDNFKSTTPITLGRNVGK
ncbi:MAG: Gfo/Idh/MocA family oxidoreductase [Ruthenibacterium sp.]